MFAVFALAAVANCELPSGYNYNRPQSGGGVSGGGQSFGGGVSSGGNYQQEAVSGNTNEGLNIDAQLLEQVKQILLREESQAASSAGGASAGGFGGQAPSQSYGAPSQSYGVPSSSYGVPSQSAPARVVGIILENTQPAIQVAQYRSQSSSGGGVSPGGNFGGYPSGGVAPAVNVPSQNYGVPSARPQQSYGAPF
jgi:hypothetical protein